MNKKQNKQLDVFEALELLKKEAEKFAVVTSISTTYNIYDDKSKGISVTVFYDYMDKEHNLSATIYERNQLSFKLLLTEFHNELTKKFTKSETIFTIQNDEL
jgi:hypothetical protein